MKNEYIRKEDAEMLFRNAREKLLEEARKGNVSDVNTRDLMLLNAEQIIHLLPSVQPKPEWIPVDEQLPEPWESVLITFSGKYGNITADHAVGLGSWDGSSNGWYFEEIGGYAKRLTVEAWQPLPEAYMAEDGEEGKE